MSFFRYILPSVFLFALCFQVSALQTEFSENDSVFRSLTPQIPQTLHDSIIDYSKLFLKTPYRSGATGENSFDCSGFTSFVYKNFGYHLDRSSSDQAVQVPTVSKKDLQKGDLVFFNGRRSGGKRVGHVGIVVETSDSGVFSFIHAAVHKGITISSSVEPYYAKRFVKAGRVIGSDSAVRKVVCDPRMSRCNYSDKPVTEKCDQIIAAKYHKVKKGETLSSVSGKYNVSVSQLKKLNHLKSSKLRIHQNLLVKEQITVKEDEKPVASEISGENCKQDSVITVKENNQIPKQIAVDDITKQTEKVTASVGNIKHKVKKGETLYTIAQKYNTTVNKLKQLNNLSSGRIVPGQQLSVSGASAQNVNAETPQKAVKHKVTSGESLYLIAKKYNTTVSKIIEQNHLDGYKIHPGQILLINNDSAVM